MSRHNPNVLIRADGHHAAGRVKQLIAVVEMQPYSMVCRVVAFESGDFGAANADVIERCILTLLRH
jgi:hypothetical protein